jgi:hypothetical protein
MSGAIYIAKKDVEIVPYFSDMKDNVGNVAVLNCIPETQILSLPESFGSRGVTRDTKLTGDYKEGRLLVGWIDYIADAGSHYWVYGISFVPDKNGEHVILDKRYLKDSPKSGIAVFKDSFLVQNPRVVTDKEQSEAILQQIYDLSEGCWRRE